MKKALWQVGLAALGTALGSWLAMAASPVTIEQDWTPGLYYATSSAATSTHSVTGVGFGYSIKATGANVSYTLHVTTRTYPPTSGYGIAVSSSVLTVVPAGTTLSQRFQAVAQDPRIVVHGLNTAATVQVWLDYGVQKQR